MKRFPPSLVLAFHLVLGKFHIYLKGRHNKYTCIPCFVRYRTRWSLWPKTGKVSILMVQILFVPDVTNRLKRRKFYISLPRSSLGREGKGKHFRSHRWHALHCRAMCPNHLTGQKDSNLFPALKLFSQGIPPSGKGLFLPPAEILYYPILTHFFTGTAVGSRRPGVSDA